ncbi:uncharacterized protein BXIN_0552 [Babesia sp. Xinjiang]|uniref:uncharacterized protein n=1 Tax=Babesia sp. Xinjiang TaxID=462227 RepID=UPI000A21F762|nr:uncharacterized protein BXIN_0552 [Babesia sp. Xinjiang]ORM41948.1 hypothetical protein BXIN_0552 [Babesia sp. Xinjiang]
MVHGLWNPRPAIYAAALIISIYPIGSVILDISQQDFPPYIDIFVGSFWNGGIYRMFHSHGPLITLVKCGDEIMFDSSYQPALSLDVYVQDYRRQGRHIISVSRFNKVGFKLLKTTFYEKKQDKCTVITRGVKDAFVGSHIALPLALDAYKLHPYIIEDSSAAENEVQYRVPTYYSSRGSLPVINMRSAKDVFIISPILNIYNTARDPNSPSPSIHCYAHKVDVALDRARTTIWIKRGRFVDKHVLNMPPLNENIFRPSNILNCGYDLVLPLMSAGVSNPITVNIDISSTDIIIPEIIILDNLRRGDWLYRQYSVMPAMEQNYIYIGIIDSMKGCEIYKETNDTFVTHVEVFFHVDIGTQYVVININRRRDSDYGNNKRLYRSFNMEQRTQYVDLTDFWVDPYLEMLYNIPLGPGVDKQDAHDIMMHQLLL